MVKIEGIRISNFRALKDLALGRIWLEPEADALTPMTAVIGKNGVGKSTLFDAFGFLADCLKNGVEEACDSRGRGGFEKILSQGESGPISFDVFYKADGGDQSTYVYELSIDVDSKGRPYVKGEFCAQVRAVDNQPRIYYFLRLDDGSGFVWKEDGTSDGIALDEVLDMDENDFETSENSEKVVMENQRMLGIATLGSLQQHPRLAAFRRFMEGWYLSYFTPDAARGLPHAGPQRHLNIHGDNLGNVVQFMMRDHPEKFGNILKRIAMKIPGINKIDTENTSDGRLLLRFNDRGFQDPFFAQQMSDGTLKMFAYLLLLEDPEPPPFLCIEEPENGLYPRLLEELAHELREHATASKNGTQVFVTTHQPYFVDALEPEEVWILEKSLDGFATIRRASESGMVKNMVVEGLPLGGLWYSNYLDTEYE